MTKGAKIGLLAAGIMMLGGFAAWISQLSVGLVLTNMRNSYSWGLYVSGLAFFVGNAAGGLVLSSMIYLFGVTSLKPFAKIGALTALANVSAAMIVILPDIGKPFRAYQMLLHPRFSSPLIWDVIVLTLYAVLSFTYLSILMMPDLTKVASNFDDPKGFSEKWAKRMAPFSLVAAISIHVVTAWIFATQGSRGWWHSAVLAPDFVAAAVASGTSIVFLVSVLAYGIKEQYRQAYRTMAIFISIAFLIHLFLMYNDFFIHAWYGEEDKLEILSVTFKDYGVAHAFEVIAPLLGITLLLNSKLRKKSAMVISGCCLLIAGIFVHRFLIMPAAFDKIPLTIAPMGLQDASWAFPIASGNYDLAADTFVTKWRYFPSGIEIMIFSGVLAFMCFL